MKIPVLLGIALVTAVLCALIYTSWGNQKYRVEVCMAYEGNTACRKASAATREQALRSATDNACAQIASGVTATMGCTASNPTRLTWLKQ